MAAAKRKSRTPAPRSSAYDSSWRRLHPERAAEERGFRKAQAEARKAHAKRDKLEDGGTAETRAKAAKVHQGSLARLYQLGHLTIDQLAASQVIAQVAQQIGADVRIGTFSLETRVDQSRGGHEPLEGLLRVRTEIAYSAWRARPGAAVLLSMILEDLSLSAAAKLFPARADSVGVRKERARGIVSGLLDAWRDDWRDACNEVDEADLLAMQAGL